MKPNFEVISAHKLSNGSFFIEMLYEGAFYTAVVEEEGGKLPLHAPDGRRIGTVRVELIHDGH